MEYIVGNEVVCAYSLNAAAPSDLTSVLNSLRNEHTRLEGQQKELFTELGKFAFENPDIYYYGTHPSSLSKEVKPCKEVNQYKALKGKLREITSEMEKINSTIEVINSHS
jgi:hypothetical protein